MIDENVLTGPNAQRPNPLPGSLLLPLRHWPALLGLWLAALLTVLPFALLPGAALSGLAHRPVIARMADGIDAWQWLDLLSVLRAAGVSGENIPGEVQQTALGLLAFAALASPLGGLIAAFLYGGLLSGLRESAAAPDQSAPYQAAPDLIQRARRFARGGWHWWGAFILLGLLQFLSTLVLLLPILFFAGLLAGSLGGWGRLIYLPVAVLVICWTALFEQARVLCVQRDQRNPLRGLGHAFMAILRRPLPWAGLYLGNLALWAGLQAAFRLGILPALAAYGLLALVAQQGFVLLRLYLTTARLAGGMLLSAAEAPPRPDFAPPAIPRMD